MSSSKGKGKGKDKDPSAIHPGLKPLDYLNPKIGSMYFRFQPGQGLRYTSTEAFLAWKNLPSTKSSTTGTRPFYIFLHDYGSSSRIFDKLVSRIQNYSLAVDLKGWGRSDDTSDEKARAYSVSQMKNDIPRIVNLLQGERFILAGHGMGAKVAQLYATQQPPKNLGGLVLLAPAPLSRWRPSADIMEKYKAAYIQQGGGGGNLESFILNTLANFPIDESDLWNLIEDGMKDTPLAKEAWLTYGMDEDFSHGLGRIKVPVLVRSGEEDKIIPLETVEQEVSNKMELYLHLMADSCDHLIPLEDDRLPWVLEQFGKDSAEIKAGTRIVEGKPPGK